jgi:hypothetical protein
MGGELWRGTFLGTLCQVSDRPLYQDQLLVQWVIGVLRRIGVPLLVLAFCPVVLAMDFPRMAPVRVDHHVHLNSPAIQAFLPEFCASVRRFGPCDPALTTPHSVQEPKSVPATSPVPVCLISSGTKDAGHPIEESTTAHHSRLLAGRQLRDCLSGCLLHARKPMPVYLSSSRIRYTYCSCRS